MTTTPNPLDSQKLRRELLLEQAINKRLDELVRLATEAVLTLPKVRDHKLEESQLRNLAAVASGTRSIEVIVNFIRYQIGRASDKWGMRPDEFGHTVIGHLYKRIAELATEVAREVEQRARPPEPATGDSTPAATPNQPPDTELRAEVYIILARQYIGYLDRTFYFYKKSSKHIDIDEIRGQLEEVLRDK
jgi:hypothetical protein